jgi:hypothetical protein
MSRSERKQRCAMPGCKAWAVADHDCCAAHLSQVRALSWEALLRALEGAMQSAWGADAGPPDDLAVLNAELRDLYAVRALYLAWLREHAAASDEDAAPPEPPSRLLRAWAETTARVIQLVRARRALSAVTATSFDALMQDVLDKVDVLLATGEEGEPQRHRGHRENTEEKEKEKRCKEEDYYNYSLF